MTITLLQMAERVLDKEKGPLTAWEIWQVAEHKGLDKLVDPTSSTALSSLISADVKDNPSSSFVTLSDRPKRFSLKSQMYSLRPGKKVRILQHFNDIVDDFTHITVVYATKDSVGIILSYEEYSAHEYELFFSDLEKRSSQDATLRHAAQDVHLRHLAWVKSGIEARTHFPIRFEEFVPLPEQDYAKLQREYTIVDMACQVGATVILPTEAFVIIAET